MRIIYSTDKKRFRFGIDYDWYFARRKMLSFYFAVWAIIIIFEG